MVSLEDMHRLRWEVDARFTTDVGVCVCGWRCWAPSGKEEAHAAHATHLDFVRRRQAEAATATWERECREHKIEWNVNHDAARCSKPGCLWFMEGATNTAKAYVSWNAHLEGLKANAVTS